jgi:hypothetical protein
MPLMMRMMSWAKGVGAVDGVLLLANAIGAVIYLLRARHGWVMPEEEANGIHVITGEPMIWALYVLPVCVAFLLVNIIWGGTIALRRRWLQGRVWLTSAFIWVVAVLVDFAHH